MNKHIQETIDRMKRLGEMMASKTFPNCDIGEDEDLIILKSTEILIDGYTVILFYSVSDYPDQKMKTLQIHSKNHNFLPFNIVCKVAKKFLGEKYISLLEILSGNKKIYCWTIVCDKKDAPIMNPYNENYIKKEFGDFNYYLMEPDKINFY
jgi:hypothetical protein